MKFKELIELSDRVSVKIGRAVSVGITYWRFGKSGNKELRYGFYREDSTGTLYFDTALSLKSHMENILNPPTNESVDVKVFGKIINGLAEEMQF